MFDFANRSYNGLCIQAAAQGVDAWHFLVALYHLIEASFGNQAALEALVNSIGYKPDAPVTRINETVIMLMVLAVIAVVMKSNLLIMLIVGATPPSSAD